MSKLKELIPVEKAARQIGMARDRCRQLCIETGIAVRWGGTDEHPRLKVRMEDLEAAVMAQKYQPPKQATETAETKKKPRTFRRPKVECSDVRC